MSEVKPKRTRYEIIELVVVIMLGITAVATAWSSWQGGLHGSQMDQKYAESNLYASEGNSEYNAAIQTLTQDMMLYNEINGLMIDQVFAETKGDDDELEKLDWKISELISGNMSEDLWDAFVWALDESERIGETVSPFEMDGFMESYFEYALDLLAESEEIMEEGNVNSAHSDNQGLVSVIYAVVLFLLGVTSTLKGLREKYILLVIAGIGFLSSTIFMLTIPIVFP